MVIGDIILVGENIIIGMIKKEVNIKLIRVYQILILFLLILF